MPKTINLYHGTTSAAWAKIQEHGIRPADYTNAPNRWDPGLASRAGMVYLSTAYPVYFGAAARETGEDVVVVRCKVPTRWLLPDEDFLGHALQYHNPGLTLTEATAMADPLEYRHAWKASLLATGCVACRGYVPLGRVTGARVLPGADWGLLLAIGADAMPGPQNYMVCGAQYRQAMARLFQWPFDKFRAWATAPRTQISEFLFGTGCDFGLKTR